MADLGVSGMVSLCLDIYDLVSNKLEAVKANKQQSKFLHEKLKNVVADIRRWKQAGFTPGATQRQGLQNLIDLLNRTEMEVDKFGSKQSNCVMHEGLLYTSTCPHWT